MTDRPYTGPTAIRQEGDSLHIDGYPDAERIVELASPLAKRLADLRLHQSVLKFSEAAMQEFGKIRANPGVASEAMLIGIVTTYFSCFGDNEAVARINPDRVFKNLEGAKDCFIHWRNIRNKHMTHNESELSTQKTTLVLGPNHEVQDVMSINTTRNFSHDDEHCQLLYRLISHTLGFVATEIDALLPKVFEEANSMSPLERASLPRAKHVGKGSSRAAFTRGKHQSEA